MLMDWGRGKDQKKFCPKGKTWGTGVIDFGLETGTSTGHPRWVLRWLEPKWRTRQETQREEKGP